MRGGTIFLLRFSTSHPGAMISRNGTSLHDFGALYLGCLTWPRLKTTRTTTLMMMTMVTVFCMLLGRWMFSHFCCCYYCFPASDLPWQRWGSSYSLWPRPWRLTFAVCGRCNFRDIGLAGLGFFYCYCLLLFWDAFSLLLCL